MITALEAQTREMQRQLNMVLLLQAVVPFASEVLPAIFISVNLLFALPLRYECYMVTILYMWMPALNPLMALTLIRSYRAAIWRLLRLGKGGETQHTLPVSFVGATTMVRPSSMCPTQRVDWAA